MVLSNGFRTPTEWMISKLEVKVVFLVTQSSPLLPDSMFMLKLYLSSGKAIAGNLTHSPDSCSSPDSRKLQLVMLSDAT